MTASGSGKSCNQVWTVSLDVPHVELEAAACQTARHGLCQFLLARTSRYQRRIRRIDGDELEKKLRDRGAAVQDGRACARSAARYDSGLIGPGS